jgi:GTP cyclohydrolase III
LEFLVFDPSKGCTIFFPTEKTGMILGLQQKGKQNQGKRESILAEYESQLEEGWVSILHFDINGCPRRKIQRGAD